MSLRKVAFKRYVGGCNASDGMEAGFSGKAQFHCWANCVVQIYSNARTNDAIVTKALVELPDGTMMQLSPDYIKFLD